MISPRLPRKTRRWGSLLGTFGLLFSYGCQSNATLSAIPRQNPASANPQPQLTAPTQSSPATPIKLTQPAQTPATGLERNDAQPSLSLSPQSVTAPPQGVTAPPQGITAPPQGITAPPQGITAPPQGFTYVQARLEPDGFQTQSEAQSSTAGRYYLKLNHQLLPENFTPSSDGAQELTALVSTSILTSGEFRVEAGTQDGQAREYLFTLPSTPLVRITLRLFPNAKRQGELGLQTSLDAALSQQLSLNLPDPITGLQGLSACLGSTLGVSHLSLTTDALGQVLSWDGTGSMFTVRVDGAILGETTAHSLRLALSGHHQISVQPRLDGCLLAPGAALLDFNGSDQASDPVPSALPSPAPTATPAPGSSPEAASSGGSGVGIDVGVGLGL